MSEIKQYRFRRLTGFHWREERWSEWQDGLPMGTNADFQYEYRDKKQSGEMIELKQYRFRRLTGSIGLEGRWSEWQDGLPMGTNAAFQYEFRKKRGGDMSEWISTEPKIVLDGDGEITFKILKDGFLSIQIFQQDVLTEVIDSGERDRLAVWLVSNILKSNREIRGMCPKEENHE